MNINRATAENLAEKHPCTYFLYRLNEELEFKDLEKKATESLAEKNPYYYFNNKFHENS